MPTLTNAEIKLSMDGVSFSYGTTTALEQITCHVAASDFIALVGPNGGGKTTFVRLALGLLKPQHGAITLLGQPLPRLRSWRRIGYVPQRTGAMASSFPATVREIVAQGLYPGFPSLPWSIEANGHERLVKAMKDTDILPLQRRRISELSVGQQQRVLIARALTHASDLLFLDEPVAGVDVDTQVRLYHLLERLNRDRGVTIVLVSHDIEAVARQATRVLFLNRTVQFDGPSDDFMESHLTEAHHGGHADWEPESVQRRESAP